MQTNTRNKYKGWTGSSGSLNPLDPYFGEESEAITQGTNGKPMYQPHCFPVRDFMTGTPDQKNYKVPSNLDSNSYAPTLIIHALSSHNVYNSPFHFFTSSHHFLFKAFPSSFLPKEVAVRSLSLLIM